MSVLYSPKSSTHLKGWREGGKDPPVRPVRKYKYDARSTRGRAITTPVQPTGRRNHGCRRPLHSRGWACQQGCYHLRDFVYPREKGRRASAGAINCSAAVTRRRRLQTEIRSLKRCNRVHVAVQVASGFECPPYKWASILAVVHPKPAPDPAWKVGKTIPAGELISASALATYHLETNSGGKPGEAVYVPGTKVLGPVLKAAHGVDLLNMRPTLAKLVSCGAFGSNGPCKLSCNTPRRLPQLVL